MKQKYIQLLFVLLLWPHNCFADDKIRVLGHYGKGWASEEGIGFAQEIFRHISDLAGYPNELEVYPLNRSVSLFYNDTPDCYFASNEYSFENVFSLTYGPIDVISSVPFTEDNIYAFTPVDTLKISSAEQLQGKEILITAGLVSMIENSSTLDFSTLQHYIVDTSEHAMTMMENKRADVLIRFLSTFDDEARTLLHYDETFSLYSNKDTLTCKNTPEMIEYIKAVNDAITKGIHSGAFDGLYIKYRRTKPILSE